MNCIEYVTEERFKELRKLYPKAKYVYNSEFPESESLIFLFVDKRFAVTIKHEIEPPYFTEEQEKELIKK
jgi:hypothetical protein